MSDKPDAADAPLDGPALVTIVEDSGPVTPVARPAYQQRVINDAALLAAQMDRLSAFLASPHVMLEPAERDRQQRQLAAQGVLLSILNERISAFTP